MEFGDGTNSTLRNPTHKYSSVGNYTVALTATNAAGSNTTTKVNYIKVTSISTPVASFTSNVTSGSAPLNVAFTDTSTGAPTSWNWSFGDGTYSKDKNPVHTYSEKGKYTVSLKVTSTAGNDTITKLNFVLVDNVDAAQYAYIANEGDNTVSIIDTARSKVTATVNVGVTPQGVAVTPDGSKVYVANSDSNTVSVIDTATNAVIATMPVGIRPLGIEQFIGIIPVQPVYPVANFSSNVTNGTAPLSLQFADLSTNAAGWNWDFGDENNSTEQNPVHTYSTAGNYTVTLIVINGTGTSSKSATINVSAKPALSVFPGCTKPPTDSDHDGLYEDINGNGRLDFADLTAYFNNILWIKDNEPVALFDYNHNGRPDFNDITVLFNMIPH